MTLTVAPARADPFVSPQRISSDSIETLFTRAATANSFAPIPVSHEKLRAIWDLSKWPPTSANFQPLRVMFVQSAEARARLGEVMSEKNRPKTVAAPAVAVLAFDRSWPEHLATTTPHLAHLQQHYCDNEVPRIVAARENSWLQAGHFILAVRALGLAAGPMLGFDAPALDQEFFRDGRWGSLLVVNIGHPTVDSYRARLPRLDQSQTVRFV